MVKNFRDVSAWVRWEEYEAEWLDQRMTEKNKLEADYKDKVIHIEMTDLLIKEDEGSWVMMTTSG